MKTCEEILDSVLPVLVCDFFFTYFAICQIKYVGASSEIRDVDKECLNAAVATLTRARKTLKWTCVLSLSGPISSFMIALVLRCLCLLRRR